MELNIPIRTINVIKYAYLQSTSLSLALNTRMYLSTQDAARMHTPQGRAQNKDTIQVLSNQHSQRPITSVCNVLRSHN